MKIKIYLLFFILIGLLMTNSCNDCPLEKSPTTVCKVREATITKFNPSLQEPILPDTVWIPVPEYSIHTFLFPSDNSNSGMLTNDSRFEEDERLIMAQESFLNPFGGDDLIAVIYDIYPFNSIMVGDMMVIGVDSLLSFAVLRLYGKVARMPEDFMSENADEFCEDYIGEFDENYINYLREAASSYGASLPNASTHSYNEDNITVIDKSGNTITNVTAPVDVVNDLLAEARDKAIDITVVPGQVYYYKARNSKEFAVVIADITEGTFEPNKKRVTIMFTALR